MPFDFDFDGHREYLFRDEKVNCYVQTGGASVFELDYLPEAWNYLDTFSLSPPAGGRRNAFADYLFPLGFTPGDAREGPFPGSRFCGGERFEIQEIDRVHGKVCFRLSPRPGVPYGRVEVEKTYRLDKDVLSVDYSLINRGEEEENFLFAPGIDLSFPGEGEAFLKIFQGNAEVKDPGAGIILTAAAELKFQDLKNTVAIKLCSDQSFDAWIFSIKTPERPGGETWDHYQSTWILPHKPVLLKPGAVFKMAFTLEFSS
jgi:hypothetical protein